MPLIFFYLSRDECFDEHRLGIECWSCSGIVRWFGIHASIEVPFHRPYPRQGNPAYVAPYWHQGGPLMSFPDQNYDC